jgi:hypothetical protein
LLEVIIIPEALSILDQAFDMMDILMDRHDYF